jgi:hypothetical protein
MPSPANPSTSARRRRAGAVRVVGAVGVVVVVVVPLLSTLAGGGRRAATGGPGSPSSREPPATAADLSARASCAAFDRATARLAAKDDKGFVDDMATAASAAQDAASRDQQWELLVGHFAAFANDLSNTDPTSVYNDLTAINEECAAVRGPRQLVLNPDAKPATGASTTTPTTTTGR